MPKRKDLQSVLVIGSGPIVIGQACEFDYSGVQACKALKEEGLRVILVNSNPATIMTDPEFSDQTYLEPIAPEVVELIIAKERPDALLPTLGGQTALNTAVALHEAGVLERYGVRLIGASIEAIRKAEDRQLFKEAMVKIGLDVPVSGTARSMEEAREVAMRIGRFPLVLRPAFTLGGTGGGIAYNREEFDQMVQQALEASPVREVLIEESLLGWKEFEMEVMRDRRDHCVLVCSIENVDPMGIHTGDSITVAPAQTLSDKEYQNMREAAFAVIREVGVETGGSNIQFAVHPQTGRMVVIEMNPRVSRSSALASKATGFPIAKIAAKLAVGYTLDELPNDITRYTPASFEPTIDYVVVKLPRFTFEKFPEAERVLTTSMKSVGEVMGIGRNFKEALQKAIRALETGMDGLGWLDRQFSREEIRWQLLTPGPDRIHYIAAAFRGSMTVTEIADLSKWDPWFLEQIREIVEAESQLQSHPGDFDWLDRAKKMGFSDRRIARLWNTSEQEVRQLRSSFGIRPAYRLVDTCAAEFDAVTPYYYSSYDRTEDEVRPGSSRKVMILGSGPNRIGQGIEFDYCCVHAAFALREMGWLTIMVNSNPETVSTDYDTSDRLYFEPITLEDVLEIYQREAPHGVIVQFGGQTPLNFAQALAAYGVPVLGTSVESIRRAEDRKLCSELIADLGLKQPPSITATNEEEAVIGARKIGYPVLVRPSFVLGGRAIKIVYGEEELRSYVRHAVEVSPQYPVLVDRFLEDAVEVDVDCVSDGQNVVVGAIMEHIEYAGVHSGDSACIIPAPTLSESIQREIREATRLIARALEVRGLINIQFAVKGNDLYVLEVNPRASRTVPFVSKAIGVPLAKIATQVIMGKSLAEVGFTKEISPPYYAVKEAVFPFFRFPGVDILLGPEMKSTGEVMGMDRDLGMAYAKTQLAASPPLPKEGKVFLSVRDSDKPIAVEVGRRLVELGFQLYATEGTSHALRSNGVPCTTLFKLSEGRPNVLDMMKNGEISLVINTPAGSVARRDEVRIRTTAVLRRIPVITTMAAAKASVLAMERQKKRPLEVCSLQEYHALLRDRSCMGDQHKRLT
ncbi:carbamoyl-phosphate synthase large subunit [Candidatus Methylacidithermus pantelleriae]|uniref:Carbamoyl phosphate synthase large chain n=1 Tax=Candidatus Methylacidithermus pantelleriae TaxID=2744239 RepID=A0A8J2FS70_9BACT|nr:carbamoyl-phosphate synthase large subunit [Candidatus Methylacidithermus pantelleriae]CAF0696397.1 carbamoyl phosphate synthetase subunit beta [Candidatus Methylacidithermus pantelleriae]